MDHTRVRIERLIKEEILLDLKFFDFSTYVDYSEGKLPTKARKGKKTRRQDVLQLIHTNVSGSIMLSTMSGYRYFITFMILLG